MALPEVVAFRVTMEGHRGHHPRAEEVAPTELLEYRLEDHLVAHLKAHLEDQWHRHGSGPFAAPAPVAPVPPVTAVNQRSLGQRMKDTELITGMYSGKSSEDIYEFAAKFQDCQHLYPPSENPDNINNGDRTSVQERVTILNLLLNDSANTYMTSRNMSHGLAKDWHDMMDTLIGEFMQHKAQISRLVYRINLHMRASEASSKFLSIIRLVLKYLANKDFGDYCDALERDMVRVRREDQYESRVRRIAYQHIKAGKPVPIFQHPTLLPCHHQQTTTSVYSMAGFPRGY